MDISVESITLQRKGKIILSEVSHAFTRSKITVILGKSGSGKTTLLQLLNGMVRPDSGSISISNRPINYKALPTIRQKMGYVIQQAGLFPHLNIRENILILGNINELSKEFLNSRLEYLLTLVQLPTAYLEKYPYELSGGEQQRVGLCRAMLLSPPIMLMDEPFASLDYETKQVIYRHLLHIQETEPRTIILITHDWDEAIKLADEFIWLEDGKIKATGNCEELIKTKMQYFETI